jgi:hypothetical protein
VIVAIPISRTMFISWKKEKSVRNFEPKMAKANEKRRM